MSKYYSFIASAFWRWFLIIGGLVATAFGILWIHFRPVLRAPGEYLFTANGDAIKSYYCTAFYTRYGSDLWFTGMNYPFGDYLTYTDGQPLLASITAFVHHNLWPLDSYGIAAVNLLMLLTMLITPVFMYLILRRLYIPAVLSFVAAIIITFLSPQLNRITAHFSLSYTFTVPVLWYIIIRMYENRNSWTWPVIYVAFTILMGWWHPYLVVLSSLFLLSYVLVHTVQNWSLVNKNYGILIRDLATALLPVILFQIMVSFADPVDDRPNNPYGFFEYYSNFNSVFFPVFSPLSDAWVQIFNTARPEMGEGFAYVGLLGLAVLILLIIKVARYLIRLKFRLIFRPVLPAPLQSGIWAATVVLLFSFCFPFRFGFEWVPDLIPPLKQFRSLGRFALIFYYVFTAFVVFYLYQLYRYLALRRAAAFGVSLLAILLLIWLVEARINIYNKSEQVKANKVARFFLQEDGNYTRLLQEVNLQPGHFQAILPIPFYHIGSEKFWIEGSGGSIYHSMKASLNTGLPIAAVMLSRTSLRQTIDLMQLVGNRVLPRPVLETFPSQKPFLMLVDAGANLRESEKLIVSKSKYLRDVEGMQLYEAPLEAFAAETGQVLQEVENSKASYITSGELLTKTGRPDVLFQSFSGTDGDGFLDKGEIFIKKGPASVFKGAVPYTSASAEYEVSMWASVYTDGLPAMYVREISAAGEKVAEKEIVFWHSTDLAKGWVRGAGNIKLSDPGNTLDIVVLGKDLVLDNLLIRPVEEDVLYFSPQHKVWVKNNFPLFTE